jgi:hypothetical protein
MGGVPIIGDVVETVTDVISPKKTTAQTRPTETAKKTEPEKKRDITRTLRRRVPRTKRIGSSLVGGRLTGDTANKDLSPIRNPRDQSTLGA